MRLTIPLCSSGLNCVYSCAMAEEVLYPTEMIKTFWFSTLRDIGYATDLSVHNPLPVTGVDSQPMTLSLRIFEPRTSSIPESIPIGTLAPECRMNIDIESILNDLSVVGDVVGVLHMTPSEFVNSDEISIAISTLQKWTSISDEFVGYRHLVSGIKSGVHYQSGHMNDFRISTSKTIIMQSPKIVISDRVDTKLLLFTPSSDYDNHDSVSIHIAILHASGEVAARTSVTLGMRQRTLISVKKILSDADQLETYISNGGYGMMVGLAQDGNVVPLSLAADSIGGLAIDHTLPPPYYIPWWGGNPRKRATQDLINKFFSDQVISQ